MDGWIINNLLKMQREFLISFILLQLKLQGKVKKKKSLTPPLMLILMFACISYHLFHVTMLIWTHHSPFIDWLIDWSHILLELLPICCEIVHVDTKLIQFKPGMLSSKVFFSERIPTGTMLHIFWIVLNILTHCVILFSEPMHCSRETVGN